MILTEKPQCPDIQNETDEIWSKDLFMRLLQNFQTMNPTDREKYLKLYSRYTMEELHQKLAMDGSDPTISDLILKLYGIYETNKFKGGVGIQAARLVCNFIILVILFVTSSRQFTNLRIF